MEEFAVGVGESEFWERGFWFSLEMIDCVGRHGIGYFLRCCGFWLELLCILRDIQ